MRKQEEPLNDRELGSPRQHSGPRAIKQKQCVLPIENGQGYNYLLLFGDRKHKDNTLSHAQKVPKVKEILKIITNHKHKGPACFCYLQKVIQHKQVPWKIRLLADEKLMKQAMKETRKNGSRKMKQFFFNKITNEQIIIFKVGSMVVFSIKMCLLTQKK